MIVYLIGQPCSGKTTISNALKHYLPDAVQIDGDNLRQFFMNKDYSKEGRLANIRNAHQIALMLATQDKDVIISLVSPYELPRMELSKECAKEGIGLTIFHLEYDTARETRGREEFHVKDFEECMLAHKILTYVITVDETVELIYKAAMLDDRIFHAKSANCEGRQTAAYIGRYQPWHDGHAWLVERSLSKGLDVVIMVRNCLVSPMNPWKSSQVREKILEYYSNTEYEYQVSVIVIPDISSINFGRGVGYDVIEWIPPHEISQISATKIREGGNP